MYTLRSVQNEVIKEINRDWVDKSDEEIKMMCFAGLAEEAGEVLGVAKRRARKLPNDIGGASDKHLIEEMGDVLWYLAALATTNGLSLEQIWLENREKLNDRYSN